MFFRKKKASAEVFDLNDTLNKVREMLSEEEKIIFDEEARSQIELFGFPFTENNEDAFFIDYLSITHLLIGMIEMHKGVLTKSQLLKKISLSNFVRYGVTDDDVYESLKYMLSNTKYKDEEVLTDEEKRERDLSLIGLKKFKPTTESKYDPKEKNFYYCAWLEPVEFDIYESIKNSKEKGISEKKDDFCGLFDEDDTYRYYVYVRYSSRYLFAVRKDDTSKVLYMDHSSAYEFCVICNGFICQNSRERIWITNIKSGNKYRCDWLSDVYYFPRNYDHDVSRDSVADMYKDGNTLFIKVHRKKINQTCSLNEEMDYTITVVFSDNQMNIKSDLGSKHESTPEKVFWRNNDGKIECRDDDCPNDCNSSCPIYLQTIGIEKLLQNKPTEAVEWFNKALKLAPDFVEAWNNKGTSFGMLKKYEEALNCYQKAYDLDDDNTNSIYGLAVTYKNLGKYDKSIHFCNKYDALQNDGKADKVRAEASSLRENLIFDSEIKQKNTDVDSRVTDNEGGSVNSKEMCCRKCGAMLIEGAMFCNKCGTKIEKEHKRDVVKYDIPFDCEKFKKDYSDAVLKMFIQKDICDEEQLCSLTNDHGTLKDIMSDLINKNYYNMKNYETDEYIYLLCSNAFGAGIYAIRTQWERNKFICDFTDSEYEEYYSEMCYGYNVFAKGLKIMNISPESNKGKFITELLNNMIKIGKNIAGENIDEYDCLEAMMCVAFNSGITLSIWYE